MTQRFVDLALYAQRTGCEGVLFTCSAFGPAIEAAAAATGLPTLKPNEAMFAQALEVSTGPQVRLGLVATFEASFASMAAELEQMARAKGRQLHLKTSLAPGAMQNLAQGRVSEHHRKVVQAASGLQDCDAVMLAQFSMADAQSVVQASLDCPVLSSPDCAVLAMKETMNQRVGNGQFK
jgi:Asp/Glu/hydantoin racemase